MKYFFLSLFLAASLFIPQFVNAATEVTLGGAFSARFTPPNPEPLSKFTVSLSSFTDDLKRAVISWVVNGKEIAKGTGLDSQEVTMGPSGAKTVLSIKITTVDGGTIQKIITSIPASLDVVWEAQTTAPNLYRGKHLPSAGALINLSSTIEGKDSAGKTLSSQDISFSWKQDGQELPNISGKGKATASIEAPTGAEETVIELSATTADTAVVATKVVTIPIVKPFIALYENKPLTGTSLIALGNSLPISGDEATLQAEPYFFSKPASLLLYVWKLNSQTIDPYPTNPKLLTLRVGNSGGTAQLSLLVQNPSKTLQQAAQRLGISFGNTTTGQ